MKINFIPKVIIQSAERVKITESGRSIYVLKTDQGDYKTRPDGHVPHMIENMTHGSLGTEPWVIGNPENPIVDLIVDGNNEVWGFEYNGKSYP